MTDDKDSAVPDSGLEAAIHKAEFIYNEICRFGYGDLRRTVLDHVEQLTALRQPTQSDALLEGDAQTILYLLGVRHGREDERAKIAAEASQPTQSDALREALEKVITSSNLEKAHEIAATTLEELRQPTQSDALREAVIEECAKALEDDAMKCDCAALEERECGCGAWCEWKSITSARAVEIVRELKKVPPPEGDGDQ
jgi:hypothetical protein